MGHRIFVGSSVEHLNLVEAIEANFQHDLDIEVRAWTTVFGPGRSNLENLLQQTKHNDVAVCVFVPVDETKIREGTFQTVRDNVVFELGLFTGAHGLRRVFWIVPQGAEKMHLPTDLAGYSPLTYKPPSDGNWSAALRPACARMREAILKEDRARADEYEPAPLAPRAIDTALLTTDRTLRRLASAERPPATIREEAGHFILDRSGTKPEIRAKFGAIEECPPEARHAAVALPVNEFFDDCSINHEGSTVHAYAQRHFSGRVDAFNKLVAERLGQRSTHLVHRDTDSYADSLGVAECIYLEQPLGSPLDVVLVSVARMRPSVGIRTEPHYLFAALHQINAVMNEHHCSHLYVPLLGSGRGGLSPELSFFTILLGLLDLDLEEVTVVIFPQRKNQMKPEAVRRLMSLAAGIA